MSAQKYMRTKPKNDTVAHDHDSYKRFLKQLQLLGLGLVDCSADLRRRLYFDLQKQGPSKQIAAKYHILDIEEDFFNALAHFELNISDKKGKKHGLSINCGFVAHFHFSDKIQEDYIEQFVATDFRLIVWPYFREFVNDMTARMSIPPLLVPLSEPE